MVATIARWGNSAGVRIPAAALRASGLKIGDLVEAQSLPDRSIMIRAAAPRRAREESVARVTKMVAAIKPTQLPDTGLFDDGAVGREVW
jgi:antitoxin component of MazEF toxin-antitoxin module